MTLRKTGVVAACSAAILIGGLGGSTASSATEVSRVHTQTHSTTSPTPEAVSSDVPAAECGFSSKLTITMPDGSVRGFDAKSKSILPTPEVQKTDCDTGSTNRGVLPPYGRKVGFEPKYPRASLQDGNGRWDGQITYSAAGLPMAWKYQVNPLLAPTNINRTASAEIWRDGGGCYYEKIFTEVLTYNHHATCRNHKLGGTYIQHGKHTWTMMIQGKPTPARIDWAVQYKIFS
mgnify:CR=1 FL=1